MRTNEKVKHELIVGKRIGFYQLHGKIGFGNFSQVKLGIHNLTKEKVAIKILDKKRLDAKTWQLFSCEVLSMERLHHPNIIRLYEVLETHHRLHLVLEYAGGGELFTKIGTWGRLSEHEAKLIFIQIVSAVKHMHENNVVHRDLKAENIFYSSKNCVKVGDFGFSALCIQDQLLTTCCGSPPYAAPELFREKNYMGIYVDTWALGVLLYFMVTANMPFRADTVRKLRKTILMGSYTIPAYVSDACQSLIRAILQPVPSNRSSPTQLLNSTWLRGMEYPEPYQPFHLNPAHLISSLPLTEEEREVKNTLNSFGITEGYIHNNHCSESHKAITGTYRIVLHQVQKRRRLEIGGGAIDSDCSVGSRVAHSRRKHIRAHGQTSKICSFM
eukprot:gi/632968829/ref/XP_007900748.1/ PREDICTED: serine/threonine-protein kinase NIM1 [Callorhinchus milii]